MLFEGLKSESQEKLDAEFQRSVAPYRPGILITGNKMRDVLQPHANAFVDWRYLHEPQQNIMSDKSLFVATLEMVLREFKKCYRTEKASLPWPSS